jgi:hypothetical protein
LLNKNTDGVVGTNMKHSSKKKTKKKIPAKSGSPKKSTRTNKTIFHLMRSGSNLAGLNNVIMNGQNNSIDEESNTFGLSLDSAIGVDHYKSVNSSNLQMTKKNRKNSKMTRKSI